MFRARSRPQAPLPSLRTCARPSIRTLINAPRLPPPSHSLRPRPPSSPFQLSYALISRSFASKPRRIFQVAGIPDPKVVERTNDLSKVSQEARLYYSTNEKKYIRYFLAGACIQMVFTSIGAHMLYSSWEFQKEGPEFLTRMSQEGMLMLCSAFIFLGLSCFWLVRHNARRRITSITLLPGGKRLRLTVFTMLGTVSAPFEIDVSDVVRGRWISKTDGKELPGFFVKGKRIGYSLDPEANVPNLALLKTIIKHPSNLGD